jgi:hypothetical protein
MTIPGNILSDNTDIVVGTRDSLSFDIVQGTASLETATPAPGNQSYQRKAGSVYISGTVGIPITPVDLDISLDGAGLLHSLTKAVSVDWITNLPKGLKAELQPALKGSKNVSLHISGTPEEEQTGALNIVIEGSWLDRMSGDDLPVNYNGDVRFFISGAGASLQDVIIGGAVGSALNAKIELNLSQSTVAADLAAGQVGWITNLPQGLSASVNPTKAGSQVISLSISGTPTEESDEALKLVIPAAIVGSESDVNVAPNKKAIFDIGPAFTSLKYAGNITSSNDTIDYKGPYDDKIPNLPSYKDFQGMGIVSLDTTAVQQLGPDHQYYWSGNVVTYGKLMEQAQKLGADAIINVHIDYTDSVSFTTSRTYYDSAHQLTEAENTELANGTLKIVMVNGIRYLEETSRVITRNYTGTATAIKYTPGIQFYEIPKLEAGTKTSQAQSSATQKDTSTAK